jgi:hypothetical protein
VWCVCREELYATPVDEKDDEKRVEEYPYDPTTDRELAILAEGVLKQYENVFIAVAVQQQTNPGMVDALRVLAGDGDDSRVWSPNSYVFGMTSQDVRSKLAKKILERVNDLAEHLQTFRDRKMGLLDDGSGSDDDSDDESVDQDMGDEDDEDDDSVDD